MAKQEYFKHGVCLQFLLYVQSHQPSVNQFTQEISSQAFRVLGEPINPVSLS